MRFFATCWGRFRGGFGPVDYSAGEVFLMRLLFAGLVVFALPDRGDIGGYSVPQHPVGLVHFGDFAWVARAMETRWDLGPVSLNPISAAIALALIFYVVGRFTWLALPIATFLFCAVGSVWNSQGVTRHSVQIVGLILFVQSVYYVVAQIRKWRGAEGALGVGDQHRVAVWYSQQMIAAAYVITAITKLINSKGAWIKDSKYYPLQIEKTRLSDYYNDLGVADSAGSEPVGAGNPLEKAVALLDGLSVTIQNLLVAHPNMCRVFLASGLALEFFAFLALRGRFALFIYGVALIGFHLTISRVMNLHFTIHNLAILIFMVNVPFVFFWIGRKFNRDRLLDPGMGAEATPLERPSEPSVHGGR